MKIYNKLFILIFLFIIIFSSFSYAFSGKDYLGNDITFIDIPNSIDISNGYLYIKTDLWGQELKVLNSNSYYYRSGEYLYLVGTGKQYKLNGTTWTFDSNLSNGSGVRLTANGFKMYSSVDIYTDTNKTDYFYKVPSSGTDVPDTEETTTYPKYDFSSTGVLGWLNKQIETLSGISREELEQNSDFMEKVEQYRNEQKANEQTLLDKLGGILDYINPSSDKFFLKGLLEMLLHFIDAVIGFIDGLFDFLWNLIVDVFKFLFVPSEERFTAISDAVSSKFGFVDTIKDSVVLLKGNLDKMKNSPSISLDVDSRYYTGELVSIDMSWYSDYKPYVDSVITGFCYLFFLWRLYSNVPNIINGAGSGISYIDSLRGGKK